MIEERWICVAMTVGAFTVALIHTLTDTPSLWTAFCVSAGSWGYQLWDERKEKRPGL